MTTAIYPLEFTWDGESMTPLKPRLADRYYVVGEVYRLEPSEERSLNSHRHYFASVAEGWRNLREEFEDRFPTSEHLRKWALIKAGYRDERSIVATSKAEAQRLAAFMKPMDDFAVVVVSECVVTVYTAKSQSMRAMGKKDFQSSKDAVLGIIAGMIGTTAAHLSANAEKAA